MENSAHKVGAELDASANTTQSCLICRDLKPERQNYDINNIHIGSLKDDCGYCRILKSASEYLVDGHPANLLIQYKEGEPCSVKYFFNDQDSDSRYVSEAEFVIYSHEKSRLIPELGILSPYPESTELSASVNFINEQISECRTQHETCRKHPESPLPTRVLSIGSSDTDVRLVELKNVPAQYATLSHCWGNKQPVRTLMSNFEDMKRSIDANSLPIVFQQAIWIVRMLKIEYIWIDSLCIIQDSQSDWELESMQMCDYYENSFLTISTATSADSSIPFLGSRDERWLPVKLELTNGLITEDVYAQRIASKPEEEGKLFTRAWAWQEAAMSSRTIYFTPSELIWECPKHVVPQRYIPDRKASDRLGFSSVLSMLRFRLNPYVHRDINSSVGDSDDESPSGSDDLINISSPGSETRISSKALPLSRPDSPCSSSSSSETDMMDYVWDMWDNLVTYYSRRQITFVTDRLPALSGVASRVQKITKSRYLAGMWEDSLGIELCWAREHRGFRDLMTLPTAYVAPSWSWASIPGGVTNRVERTISVFEPQSTITEAYSDVPGLNLFGRVTAGHLVMRGQVAEAMLTCDDPHTSLSYKISGPADKWEFLPDSILVSSNGNVSRAKQGQKLSDFRAKIFCLYIGLRNKSYYDDKSAREHLMLVLGQSEDVDVGSSYCRLGLAYSKSDSLFNEAPTLDVKLM